MTRAESQVREAESHYRHKRFAQARLKYEEILAAGDARAEWLARLGRICERINDWRAARTAYAGALDMEPENGPWRERLAQVERRLRLLGALPEAADPGVPSHEPADIDELGRHFRAALAAAPSEGLKAQLEATGQSAVFRLAASLCDAGKPRLAFDGLLELGQEQEFAGLVSRWVLQLAERYGVFDADVVELADRSCDSQGEDLQLRKSALAIMACWEGPTPRAAAGLVALFEADPRPRHVKTLLHASMMLFRLERYEDLAALCRTHGLVLEFGEQVPSVAWYLTQHGADAGQAGRAAELLEGYRRIVEAGEQVWGRLADPSLSLAVVGNSACERGRERGAGIDAHDLVVRFNDFSLASPLDRDYGTRTTAVVRTCGTDPKFDRQPAGADIVISGLRLQDRFLSWRMPCELRRRGYRVCTYPPALEAGLLRRLRRVPSSGLSTAWIVGPTRRSRGADTSYYGFSFVDQIGANPASAHYYEKSRPSARHDWPAERELFEQLTGRPLAA